MVSHELRIELGENREEPLEGKRHRAGMLRYIRLVYVHSRLARQDLYRPDHPAVRWMGFTLLGLRNLHEEGTVYTSRTAEPGIDLRLQVLHLVMEQLLFIVEFGLESFDL